MIKNIALLVLALLVLLEGGLLIKKNQTSQAVASAMTQKPTLPPAGPNAKGTGQRPVMLHKGMNLKTTPLFTYAFQIAPNTISADTQKALTGWSITSHTQSDGSTLVSLTPKDSDDQSQQYTIKSGQVLYFIEQTPLDDKADSDTDLNYRDDYGIIVDQNGIIQ